MEVHIPVDERTRRELFRYRLALEEKMSRSVSFDEAIRTLLDLPDVSDKVVQVFLSSFGLCKDCQAEASDLLEKLRNDDESRIQALIVEEQ